MRIKFHGHSTIQLTIKNTIIYIDPYLDPFTAEKLQKADIILLSNSSYDHCSIETIHKLTNDNTIILGTRETATLLQGCSKITPGETRDFENFKIKAIYAEPYNTKKIEGTLLAYGILTENKTIFYPSDTKYLPQMAQIHPDIMLVAVGGTLVMTAKQAANFVHILMPKIAIPIHYGTINGTKDDAQYFKELVEAEQETKVIILNEDEEVEL